MLRKPKTTQERRTNGSRCNNRDEYGVKIRGKRSQKLLFEAWDDVVRGDRNYRTWKKYRKKQYKK